MTLPALDRRALLARLPIFAELGPAELDAIVAVTRAKLLESREIIVRQGEPADTAFVVVYGRLKVEAAWGDGNEAMLAVLRAGDIFGELAILDGGSRSATVTALEPALLLAIDRRKLHALLLKEPTVSYKLLVVLARRLRQLIDDREMRDVPARLAKQLLRLADEDGERVTEGVRLRAALSQRELGAMIGATRESVNKQLAALAKRGVIVRSPGRRLVIVDAGALREMAAGERGVAVGRA